MNALRTFRRIFRFGPTDPREGAPSVAKRFDVGRGLPTPPFADEAAPTTDKPLRASSQSARRVSPLGVACTFACNPPRRRGREPRPYIVAFTAYIAFATASAAVAAGTADTAQLSAALTPNGGRIVVEAQGVERPVPMFFTAHAEQTVRLSATEITGETLVSCRIVQGKPDVLTLGLVGDGEVVSVTGASLRDWAVRQGTGPNAGKRFLDLRVNAAPAESGGTVFEFVLKTRQSNVSVPGKASMALLAGGEAVAFDWRARFQPDASVDAQLANAANAVAVENDDARTFEFIGRGEGRIEFALADRGAVLPDAQLTRAQLVGRLNEEAHSIAFHFRAQARVEKPGARLRLLSGAAALGAQASGDGWRAELSGAENAPSYELVFDRKGIVPVDLDFVASVRDEENARHVAFRLSGSAVVPVTLSGVPADVEFDADAPLALTRNGGEWQGFLPATGRAWLVWRHRTEKTEAALFFTTNEQSDVRVAAGLLRQASQIAFRILQGKLTTARLRVEGPGEIVGVEGTNIVGWSVAPVEGARMVEIRFSRPVEAESTVTVHSQAVLGGFPVRAEPIRLTPEGGVRHVGFVRIASVGAVRLEVTDLDGMLQLAPEQYPGGAVETGARQVFVYRFPTAARNFHVLASQILPEVGVSEVVTYQLGDADRVIEADLELDVREAPLRDWTFNIPADYALAALQGSDVVDYNVESVAADGVRAVKAFFAKPILGRQLVHVRLEKNQPPAPGDWRLPALQFPGAKTVRGHIGVTSVQGYRVVASALQQVAELPLTFFPKQIAGLQQAYRLREADWSVALRVEALGQSVQADVFHLYALKEGAVYASVLINYFVVGAPANEWRIEVPASAGNIDVTGQGVRRDWRREGNTVVVALHQPVLGAATVLVSFEEPMSARGGSIHPGEVRPIGIQAERGYVQVVSPLQVKSEVKKADGGLLKLEPLELPAELRLFATAPSLAVYQYTARPFDFELAVNWYQPGEMADQVVDFATFRSQVARDGQVVTEARLFVKTRGRKVLRFQLPPGVKLWETRVDHELVTARADGPWTLVPLSARLNPNDPVPLVLRLGQPAGTSSRHVTLVAPKMAMPVVFGDWTVRSDAERLLAPLGGTADLTHPNLTERGFEWIGARAGAAMLVLVLLIALGGFAFRLRSVWGPVAALVAGAAAVLVAVNLMLEATTVRRVNRVEVAYASVVVPADGTVSIDVANLPRWEAMVSWPGVVALALGAGCGIAAVRRRGSGEAPSRVLAAMAAMLAGGGLLAQRTGAIWFFAFVGVAVLSLVIVPAAADAWVRGLAWWRNRRGAGAAGAASATVSLLALGLAIGGLGGAAPRLHAESTHATREQAWSLQAVVQRWSIRDGRLYAEADVTVRGAIGDSFVFLNAPAVLTDFASDGLHVSKLERNGSTQYLVVPERVGTLTGHAKFELPVPDLTKPVPILTAAAAVQRIAIDLDQPGWQFASPRAVEVLPTSGLLPGHSGATLTIGIEGIAAINLTPKQRDVSTEATQFYADIANLFVPGPGVVNAFVRVTVRPAQGRVSAVDLSVPEGLTVGDVTRGPVGTWRFDPAKRRLHVAVEPGRADAFSFVVELQQGTAPLPVDLTLRPLRIVGSAGETGSIGLAFGSDAQPERLRPSGLSAATVEDFDRDLLPRDRQNRALATLQSAYRYSGEEASLSLRVAPIAPEVRVATRQLLSLGDERVVLAADLAVSITRVGIFQLSFAIPSGLELESVSGAALSHWTEANEKGERIVTLHLNGRTLGEQAFALTLVGPIAASVATWQVPQVRVREATRQTGELQVVPEKGLRLRAIERHNVSEEDPRTAGNSRPGALAFRLLETDWSLSLGIEALEPWVTAQALEEVTVREGQTVTRLAMRYRIENAAVKTLRVRLPGLTDEQARTVRATGPAVSDVVPLAGNERTWDIRLQRGVIGETSVQIEFQGPASRTDGRQAIATPVFEGARQVTQFVAVRSGGRLEVEAPELPRGWQRADWPAVPALLQDRGDRSVPALAFRVAEPEAPLNVVVRRHDVADALKLRVASANLTTIFSPDGPALTAVELQVDVAEKSTLRVRLPDGARLFNTFMNGESVTVVRDGDAYLFHVTANTASDRTARVRLVYAVTAPMRHEIDLLGPRLNVPLENVAWRVVVPAGYTVTTSRGGLQLRETSDAGEFMLHDYESLVVSKRAADAKQATDFLQAASALLQQGQQQRATEALSRATKSNNLDEASNEDARVQLRALRTQQAIVGLNTRRQRLYLDNSNEVVRNDQLEHAASLNPLMQGKLDFDPQQVDQLLMGNTVEETTALRGIAARLVDQQLAAEPAPSAIDVTLPEQGHMLTFARSLQVNGDAPLELKLGIAPVARENAYVSLGIVAALGAIAAFAGRMYTPRRIRATPL